MRVVSFFFTASFTNALWRSDGTEEGTFQFIDLDEDDSEEPVTIKVTSIFDGSSVFLGIDDKLFFAASDNQNGEELWISDGTAEGTNLLKDINPVGSSLPNTFSDVNGTLFFSANDDVTGNELWKSDGTPEGTQLVIDINPDGSSFFDDFTDFNGTLFFDRRNQTGREVGLWKSDGTEAGTQLVKTWDVDRDLTDLTVVGDTLFFNRSGVLWKSDGTEEGTVVVAEEIFAEQLTSVGDTLFFTTDNGEVGEELWKSDGTSDGTQLIKDIRPEERLNGTPINRGSNPTNLTNVNGTLFFAADSDGDDKQNLWKSDGTAEGTQLVTDATDTSDIEPILFDDFTNVNGTLYFSISSTVVGTELWQSDGTEAGTFAIKSEEISVGGDEVRDSFSIEAPDNFLEFDDRLIFTGDFYSQNSGDDEEALLTLSDNSDNGGNDDDDNGGNNDDNDDDNGDNGGSEDPTNTIELFRFRNTTFESGTYVFVGADEKDAILADENLSNTFSLDGLQDDGTVNPAFKASLEPGNDLIPFYRLKSLDVLGTFLFVSTGEYDAIFADDSDQKDKWEKEGKDSNGVDIPEFYLLDGSADRGVEFNRFQNNQNGTCLYAGLGETEDIESDPNLSSLFTNQGLAFKSLP